MEKYYLLSSVHWLHLVPDTKLIFIFLLMACFLFPFTFLMGLCNLQFFRDSQHLCCENTSAIFLSKNTRTSESRTFHLFKLKPTFVPLFFIQTVHLNFCENSACDSVFSGNFLLICPCCRWIILQFTYKKLNSSSRQPVGGKGLTRMVFRRGPGWLSQIKDSFVWSWKKNPQPRQADRILTRLWRLL